MSVRVYKLAGFPRMCVCRRVGHAHVRRKTTWHCGAVSAPLVTSRGLVSCPVIHPPALCCCAQGASASCGQRRRAVMAILADTLFMPLGSLPVAVCRSVIVTECPPFLTAFDKYGPIFTKEFESVVWAYVLTECENTLSASESEDPH